MGIVIGTVSQKGGVGKSTIARALAREGAINNLKVKLADLDTQQGTCLSWHRRRNEVGIDPVFSVESFRGVNDALKGASGFDLLVLDGPARASAGTLEIAKHADLLVQPTGASFDDLEPAVLVFHELAAAGVAAEKLAFALSRIGTEAEEGAVRRYLKKTGYTVLNGCVYERPSYRQAMNSGKTITETQFKKLNIRADMLLQALIDRIAEIGGDRNG